VTATQKAVNVTNDVMHDEQWTAMATMGWTQQIDKLEKLLS
jgi:hypothetical protein